MEILVAITIFAFFISLFTVGMGNNINDGINFRKSTQMANLAQLILEQNQAHPPKIDPAKNTDLITKAFEDNPNFQYTLKFSPIKIPSLAALKGEQEGGEKKGQDQAEQMIFEQITQNLEKMILQLEVTVTDLTTKETYITSTWLYNQEVKVEIKGF